MLKNGFFFAFTLLIIAWPCASADSNVPLGPPIKFYQYFWGHYPQMLVKGILPFVSEVVDKYGHNGAPVRVSLGMKDLYVISDPKDAHIILSGPERDKFAKGFSSQFLRDYFVGEGLGFLETKGEGWRELHQAMFRFLNDSTVRSTYFNLMREHSQELVQSLEQRQGTVIDLEREMTIFTMQVIAKSMLNVDLVEKTASELADSFATVLKFVHYRMTNFPFYLPLFMPTAENRNFTKAKATIDGFIHMAIAHDESLENEGKNPTALISYLRKASLVPQPINPQSPDSEMLHISTSRFSAQLNNILMAGHDTTKHLLTNIFYQLARNPRVKEKLQCELRQVILSADGLTDAKQLLKDNLPYLDSVIQEALRLSSSVPAVARDVLQNVSLHGYVIPKGSVVMISFDALHKSSELWENPLEFDPDRFETRACADHEQPKNHRNSLMPFSRGERMCIGRFFALQEVKTVVVELMLAGIDFELLPDTDWTPVMACTMHLDNGLKVKIRKGDPL